MQDKLEKLIQTIYKKWKSDQSKILKSHPDEETLACFSEGKLSYGEKGKLIAHLISCDSCAEVVAVQAQTGSKLTEEKKVPKELVERMKELIKDKDRFPILEIILRLKEKTLEILNTTGDVRVGQELIPAPILRSRGIEDFKDEVIILKDFKDVRVEIKIENKGSKVFNLTVMAKEKNTQKIIKDLRVTLLKDDLELESYLNDQGTVTFEHVLLGKYTVEMSSFENKLASILLDIKT